MAWSSASRNYSSTYARPGAWTLSLDACATRRGLDSAGRPIPIVDYAWHLSPTGGQGVPAVVSHSTSCSRNVSIRAMGAWRLTLTVADAEQNVVSIVLTATLRDVLVVSIGDSYSSGEGNPDEDGTWTDTRCHRSANGWPARVARGLESLNRSTTVTFLSYACSGATLRELYETTGTGQAQVLAARQVLGAPTASSTRQIDVLLLSGGVNDLGFSDILDDCAKPFGDPCRRSLSAQMSAVPARYDALGAAVRANLKVADTFIADYPARIFTDGADRYTGCGVFSLMGYDDARWLGDQGNILDLKIAAAAATNGWVAVRTTDAFRHHGYCADGDATWFRSWSGSYAVQGDYDGTGHPRGAGHVAVAELVAAQVEPRL